MTWVPSRAISKQMPPEDVVIRASLPLSPKSIWPVKLPGRAFQHKPQTIIGRRLLRPGAPAATARTPPQARPAAEFSAAEHRDCHKRLHP
jgi:hypothetical protein